MRQETEEKIKEEKSDKMAKWDRMETCDGNSNI